MCSFTLVPPALPFTNALKCPQPHKFPKQVDELFPTETHQTTPGQFGTGPSVTPVDTPSAAGSAVGTS